MKTVALVSHSPDIGGAERMLLNLAIELQLHREIRPIVFIPSLGPSTLAAELTRIGIEWRGIQRLQAYCAVMPDGVESFLATAYASADEIAEMLLEVRADVVLVNTLTNIEAPLGAKIAGLPYVLWIHGIIDQCLYPIGYPLLNELCDNIIIDWSAWIVCCSEWTYNAYISRAAEKISVIWNWTSVPETNTHQYGKKRFSILSSILWHKGIDTALSATNILKDRGVKVELDIYGDRNLWRAPQEMCSTLDICDCVRFHERTTNVSDVYKQSLAVLMPSLVEPFGMVSIEAMAQGTPVIASRVGEQAKIVQDNVTGFVHEPGNSFQLAEKMRALIESPNRAEQLGRAAYEWAKEEFSGKKSTAMFTDLIQAISGAFSGYTWRDQQHILTLNLLMHCSQNVTAYKRAAATAAAAAAVTTAVAPACCAEPQPPNSASFYMGKAIEIFVKKRVGRMKMWIRGKVQ